MKPRKNPPKRAARAATTPTENPSAAELKRRINGGSYKSDLPIWPLAEMAGIDALALELKARRVQISMACATFSRIWYVNVWAIAEAEDPGFYHGESHDLSNAIHRALMRWDDENGPPEGLLDTIRGPEDVKAGWSNGDVAERAIGAAVVKKKAGVKISTAHEISKGGRDT